jgi:hypothetical protein
VVVNCPMSMNNWISPEEAVTIISKHSHRPVSFTHVQTLVNRSQIATRYLEGGMEFLKRSDVESTRVAVGTGNGQRRKRVDQRDGKSVL